MHICHTTRKIMTRASNVTLKETNKAHEFYIEVKSGGEKCLAFLQEKRESDPCRNILARLAYQSTHGFDSEVPTFEV
ncbi:hypothetical protein Peur_063791 [Populus x canadensis]